MGGGEGGEEQEVKEEEQGKRMEPGEGKREAGGLD
jgi:hypothetical protein